MTSHGSFNGAASDLSPFDEALSLISKHDGGPEAAGSLRYMMFRDESPAALNQKKVLFSRMVCTSWEHTNPECLVTLLAYANRFQDPEDEYALMAQFFKSLTDMFDPKNHPALFQKLLDNVDTVATRWQDIPAALSAMGFSSAKLAQYELSMLVVAYAQDYAPDMEMKIPAGLRIPLEFLWEGLSAAFFQQKEEQAAAAPTGVSSPPAP
jgi:hypothetical protein